MFVPAAADDSPLDATALARGAMRYLRDLGYRPLTEFKLKNKRRADIAAIDRGGRVVIVEVKSGVADFRADAKWPDYLDFCDGFYFAVGADFPHDILPAEAGLLVADRYHAECVRPAPERPLNGTRRKHLILQFALAAAARLHDWEDPGL